MRNPPSPAAVLIGLLALGVILGIATDSTNELRRARMENRSLSAEVDRLSEKVLDLEARLDRVAPGWRPPGPGEAAFGWWPTRGLQRGVATPPRTPTPSARSR